MLNYDKDPNLLFAVPMEEIVLKRNSYEHKKLHHYISERDYNDNIKDINHLIIDEYFKVYGLTNRLLFPIVKYFIIIIIIASIVSLYLTIIEKLTYINYYKKLKIKKNPKKKICFKNEKNFFILPYKVRNNIKYRKSKEWKKTRNNKLYRSINNNIYIKSTT